MFIMNWICCLLQENLPCDLPCALSPSLMVKDHSSEVENLFFMQKDPVSWRATANQCRPEVKNLIWPVGLIFNPPPETERWMGTAHMSITYCQVTDNPQCPKVLTVTSSQKSRGYSDLLWKIALKMDLGGPRKQPTPTGDLSMGGGLSLELGSGWFSPHGLIQFSARG